MKLKRFAALLLAVLLTVSITPWAVAADIPFTDVKESDWFFNDVKIAYESGLINGRGDGSFAPGENMRYSEAVKLAACMHQLYTDGAVTLVNGDPWYQSYVDYAQAKGIITATYDWNANATRAGYVGIFAHALPAEALAAVNSVADNAIPDVTMAHPQAAEIYCSTGPASPRAATPWAPSIPTTTSAAARWRPF